MAAQFVEEILDEDDFVELGFGLRFGGFQDSESLATRMEIEIFAQARGVRRLRELESIYRSDY